MACQLNERLISEGASGNQKMVHVERGNHPQSVQSEGIRDGLKRSGTGRELPEKNTTGVEEQPEIRVPARQKLT